MHTVTLAGLSPYQGHPREPKLSQQGFRGSRIWRDGREGEANPETSIQTEMRLVAKRETLIRAEEGKDGPCWGC